MVAFVSWRGLKTQPRKDRCPALDEMLSRKVTKRTVGYFSGASSLSVRQSDKMDKREEARLEGGPNIEFSRKIQVSLNLLREQGSLGLSPS